MIHWLLSYTSTEPIYLALTSDLDEQADSLGEQTYIAFGNEQVCLQVIHPGNIIVQEIALSHTQMGLLVNAWQTYAEQNGTSESVSRRERQEGGQDDSTLARSRHQSRGGNAMKPV